MPADLLEHIKLRGKNGEDDDTEGGKCSESTSTVKDEAIKTEKEHK